MAKIDNVDYNAIPALAEQMKTYGQELNGILSLVYQVVEDLHSYWTGGAYNELVGQFNIMIPALNKILELVVGQIPVALGTIANNYGLADTGSIVQSVVEAVSNNIVELPISNDAILSYDSAKVEEIRETIANYFRNAIDKMNQVESIFAIIPWKSEASEAFEARFNKIKADVIASFENILNSFLNLMAQTEANMQAAENANTVQ
jgi:uncharacterized protein YukE